jgi:hypothetical protein
VGGGTGFCSFLSTGNAETGVRGCRAAENAPPGETRPTSRPPRSGARWRPTRVTKVQATTRYREDVCDLPEEELAEYLLWMDQATARAKERASTPRVPVDPTRGTPPMTEPVAA